jgi:hypothetical protein
MAPRRPGAADSDPASAGSHSEPATFRLDRFLDRRNARGHHGVDVRRQLVGQEIGGPYESGAVAAVEDLSCAVVMLKLLPDDRPGDPPGRVIHRDDLLTSDHAVGERHDARVAFRSRVGDESRGQPGV